MFFNAVILASVLVAVGLSVAAPAGIHRGSATYYTPGLGACGKINGATDLIVAVSRSFFDGFPGANGNPNANPVCGKTATVHHGSKTIKVQIVDRCPGCGAGDLDLSPAAFSKLADPSAGRVPITWSL